MNDNSWLFYLGVAIASLIGAFLGAFIKRIGEDFAAQQSIQKLTVTVENIKAAISDDVWDRQEQWKLKRDAVLDAVCALNGLENALIELDSTFSVPPELCDDTAREGQELLQKGATQRFQESSITYRRAMSVIDLVVGGKLSKDLSNCFQFAGPLALVVLRNKRRALVESGTKRELAEKCMAVIRSAREALGIKDADESLLS
ncbi:MAG TPA: hypothetical protein VKG86_12450 [Terracidiphilus sp.]|nr:hypothetical protein [Terracidiphilus sp.]